MTDPYARALDGFTARQRHHVPFDVPTAGAAGLLGCWEEGAPDHLQQPAPSAQGLAARLHPAHAAAAAPVREEAQAARCAGELFAAMGQRSAAGALLFDSQSVDVSACWSRLTVAVVLLVMIFGAEYRFWGSDYVYKPTEEVGTPRATANRAYHCRSSRDSDGCLASWRRTTSSKSSPRYHGRIPRGSSELYNMHILALRSHYSWRVYS